jgi:hypothetical protein
MNTMHLADEQARILTINMAGATVTRDDKRAFNQTIHSVGEQINVEAEGNGGVAPRAEDVAERIAVALRETLAERGHALATITVRLFDPEEEERYKESAKAHGFEDDDGAPDQARIGVEFVNGVDEPVRPGDSMASVIGELLGHAAIEPLMPCTVEMGRTHADEVMHDLIGPGLKLFANEDWLAKAKAASPRGVMLAALGLMARILDYDYTMEVLAMNDRHGAASNLLRGKLIKSGRRCSEADFGDHVLFSYLNTEGGDQPQLIPWKDDAPVDVVNAVFSHSILETMKVVAIDGDTYKGLHETAVNTGQLNRFRYHALAKFEGTDDHALVLTGLQNARKVIEWIGQDMEQIAADAEKAVERAEAALAADVQRH